MKVVSVASPILAGKQTLVALTSDGRMFRLDPDPRDFNTGVPGHKIKLIWTQLEGPEDPAQGDK